MGIIKLKILYPRTKGLLSAIQIASPCVLPTDTGIAPHDSNYRWEYLHKREVDDIDTQKSLSLEQRKKAYAEQAWLNYYNQVLFEAGLISELERNRIRNKISALTPSTAGKFDFRIRTSRDKS